MRVTKIRVQNFRLLKDISIELQEDLSVIVGKNNCGKTSLLLVLDKLIGSGGSKNNLSFDDFNVDFKELLKERVENSQGQSEEFSFMGISLKLFIEYEKSDDLSNIGNKVMMDLDPENNVVVLAFEYYLSENKLKSLKTDYKAYCDKKTAETKTPKNLFLFLGEKHLRYFQIARKSLRFDMHLQKEDDTVFTDLIKEKIDLEKIINFKWISASRNVSNKDSEKTLSSQSSKMYKKMESSNDDSDVIEEFKDALTRTDDELDAIYKALFQEVIDDIRKFGGIKQDDSIIRIVSSLQHKQLLEENTTVMYGVGASDHSLPENFNGLGYMNLISMIFDIKILLRDFQKQRDEKPSDINLLFIEEPEAHTHPQMQCIFIKNIKSLLINGVQRDDGESRRVQTILSTHSSHIASESSFEDIKYFKREGAGIVSKNLSDLRAEYGEDFDYYKFLKQYLTLHRSELFFADKAVFIEGDTERILLPAMMKKLDQEDSQREIINGEKPLLPLLSQNVSVIEVGAYSKIFDKFLDFVGIKSLIITDIDSVKTVPKLNSDGEIEKNVEGVEKTEIRACRVSEGTKTSNYSLTYFYGDKLTLAEISNLSLKDRILRKNTKTKTWECSSDGHLLCVYQTRQIENETEYHARTFEDAFFQINQKFMSDRTFDADGKFIGNEKFPSLTQTKMKQFAKSEIDAYAMAKAVKKKPPFATEILLNSDVEEITVTDKKTKCPVTMSVEFSNWNIPAYIREGLQWLKQE